MNEEVYKLDCGCVTEKINGKFITILCEEHDMESDYSEEQGILKFKERYSN